MPLPALRGAAPVPIVVSARPAKGTQSTWYGSTPVVQDLTPRQASAIKTSRVAEGRGRGEGGVMGGKTADGRGPMRPRPGAARRLQVGEPRHRADPAADRAAELVLTTVAATPPQACGARGAGRSRRWAARRRRSAAHKISRSVSLPSSAGSVPSRLFVASTLPALRGTASVPRGEGPSR